jgi:4-amino-4-deoxy-L-arabinose transferase-like glycosyltransferase
VNETQQPANPDLITPGARRPNALLARLGRSVALPAPAVLWEGFVLLAVTFVLLCYGLAPLTGGDRLGLVGADEPRYAQIAREMLAVHDKACDAAHTNLIPNSLRPADLAAAYHCLLAGTVTPVLYGQPWLEKPALYYWRAMGFFREFGVSDWSARLPSTSGALALIILIYLHMKRFRPGGQLDAALITASTLAIIAFSRGASTDMQLAAPFCIGMLGWYAWYETGKKFWLFDLYFFGAAATLAKGPVAPFLALCIICLFLGLRREWSALRRTIWLPGVILYLVMVLPWYIAVQKNNPTFVRSFFLEHNLERFATNKYQHHQPFWFYLAVILIGLMPWTVISIRALLSSIKVCIAEWRVRNDPRRYLGHSRAGDAFPEFLVLWAIFPVFFFSLSGSKLPGYILPAIPPITILTGDYLNRIRRSGLSNALLSGHAALCAVMVFVLVLSPQHMKYETLVPSVAWLTWAALSALTIGGIVFFITRRYGTPRITYATLIPVVGSLVFLLGFHGKELDLNYSARPLAAEIARQAPGIDLIATQNVKRDMDYGLAFYRNRPMIHYAVDGVPTGEHLLVIRTTDTESLTQYLSGRIYKPLFLYESQGLEVYKVYATGVGVASTPLPPSDTIASVR